jgi:hypothetical protein
MMMPPSWDFGGGNLRETVSFVQDIIDSFMGPPPPRIPMPCVPTLEQLAVLTLARHVVPCDGRPERSAMIDEMVKALRGRRGRLPEGGAVSISRQEVVRCELRARARSAGALSTLGTELTDLASAPSGGAVSDLEAELRVLCDRVARAHTHRRAALSTLATGLRDELAGKCRLCSKWEYALEAPRTIGAYIFATTPAWHPATLDMCTAAGMTGSAYMLRVVGAHYRGPASTHLFFMIAYSHSAHAFRAAVELFGTGAVTEAVCCAAAHTGEAELFDAALAAYGRPITEPMLNDAWRSGNDIFARSVHTRLLDQRDFHQ